MGREYGLRVASCCAAYPGTNVPTKSCPAAWRRNSPCGPRSSDMSHEQTSTWLKQAMSELRNTITSSIRSHVPAKAGPVAWTPSLSVLFCCVVEICIGGGRCIRLNECTVYLSPHGTGMCSWREAFAEVPGLLPRDASRGSRRLKR